MNNKKLFARIEELRKRLNEIKWDEDSDRTELLKLSQQLDKLITIATRRLHMKICNDEKKEEDDK